VICVQNSLERVANCQVYRRQDTTIVSHDDVSAHFSLLHLLDFLVELESLLFVAESLLLGAGGLS
jgi:hypothetical protein